MRKAILATIALGALLVPALDAAPALALNNMSFVSHSGSDGNSCADVFNACRTLQGATDKTAAGGEVSIVNAGDYGTWLFINKSINITNDGAGEATLLATSAPNAGVTINAGAGDVVSLRGLVIDGQGVGTTGIVVMNAFSAVHVQNCVVRNFEAPGGYGLWFAPNNDSQIFISDSIIYNNGSDQFSGGIFIAVIGSASVNVVLDRVHVENNVRGIFVNYNLVTPTGNGSHVVLRDSVVSGNAGDGIVAKTIAGRAPAFVVVERTSSVNNAGTGILADGPGATMLLDDDTVVRNAVGISAVNGGQLISYGNNRVNNNLGADGTPTGNYGLH